MSKDLTDAQMLEALIRKVKSETRIIGDFEIKTRTGILDGKQTTEPYIAEYLGVARQFVREISWQVFLYHKEAARALFGARPTYVHSGYNRYSTGKVVRSKLNKNLLVEQAVKDVGFVTGALSYEAWQYHVMQAVISDNPIKYMYEAVFNAK